jgi:hypothetical protein
MGKRQSRRFSITDGFAVSDNLPVIEISVVVAALTPMALR